MKNLIEELQWRGLVHDIMPGTEEQLLKEPTAVYIGFDPTSDSLHIGSLVPILLLKHIRNYGHRPIALVGGATGMIGDPSGKSNERNLLDEETLNHNVAGIKGVLSRFLDFEATDATAPVLVNNYDWMKDFSFIDFAREVGKRITVNYMMAKDSVKKRIEGETGISYTEFAYQLMQGYDFYWLYQHKNCKLQMGGSDQWGNMTTGTELIRRKCAGEAFVFTNPLITKADGGKFGKTESGNVWLDASKTTPYQFYQFWLNAADADVPRLIRVFTLYTKDQIEEMERAHAETPHLRIIQKAIAEEVTTRVHGAEICALVIEASALLFSKDAVELLSNASDALIAQLPVYEVSSALLSECQNLTDLISVGTENLICSSKGEARKAIQGNAISVNKVKITDPASPLNFDKIKGSFLLIGNGKQKNYILSFK